MSPNHGSKLRYCFTYLNICSGVRANSIWLYLIKVLACSTMFSWVIPLFRPSLEAVFPVGIPAISPRLQPTRKLSTGQQTGAFGSLLGRGLRPVGANFPRGIAPDLQTPGSAPRLRLPVPHLVRAGEAPPPPPADLPLRRRICSFSSAIDSGYTTTSTSASGESTSIPFSLASARVCPLAHLFCRSCGGRLQP